MKKREISYYNWSDIQTEICKEMGIDEKYFRDYHKLVGGKYKDFWHEWLRYFDDEVNNGAIVSCEMGEIIESKIEWVKSDGKDWLVPFVEAVYRVWDKYDIKYVKYFW